MVIDPKNGLSAVNTGGVRQRSTNGLSTDTASSQQSSNSKGTSACSDCVVLSPEAQVLNRLEAKINAAPEVDTHRVAAIKDAIANGSFEINTDRIAERMLSSDSFF